MGTPSIAHFGTTLAEAPPPEGVRQEDVPVDGALGRTLRFLEIAGFEPMVRNLYPGVGRQYIWRKGVLGAADYVEKDTFTSYRAERAPAVPAVARVADTVFRLPVSDPEAVWDAWVGEDLVEPVHEDEAGRRLLRGPDDQQYELVRSTKEAVRNHAVAIWTDPAEAATIAADYATYFGLLPDGPSEDFHGQGRVRWLRRSDPPVSIGLVVPGPDGAIAPRWTDDVFAQVGYSHFRLGSPRKGDVRARFPEAFPDTGDVSYVHVHHAYLELVAC